jgi:addiction module HigA family antidote
MLLKEFLEPLGVSQVEAAHRMRVPFQRLNAIVRRRRAVSADTALLLQELTGWDAQIWLSLQANWDLWHAQRARRRRPRVKPLQALVGNEESRESRSMIRAPRPNLRKARLILKLTGSGLWEGDLSEMRRDRPARRPAAISRSQRST